MLFINELIRQITSYATIYSLLTIGIIIGGKAGVFNIAGDGIVLVSASVGFIVSFLSNNWFLGFLSGMFVGLIFGLFFAFIHEYFKVNQFILGLCIIILGTGLSDFIYNLIIGVRLSNPISPEVLIINIPVISKIPILSSFLNQNPVVYFMYIIIFISWYFFYKTRKGLETRGIGENPKAIDVVGVNVTLRRYIATIIGSSLIGLAGAYLPLIITRTYSPGIDGGRGTMAIGIAIFVSWKPQRAIIGGFLFATIEVIVYQLQLISKNIPYQFILMVPFVSLLIIMLLFRRKLEYPAAIGSPYSRE